jgi:hypothetical protein
MTQSISEVLETSMSSMNASLEIREIINDYSDTLKTATEEIKSLNRSVLRYFVRNAE